VIKFQQKWFKQDVKHYGLRYINLLTVFPNMDELCDQWMESITVWIYNKGNKYDCINYCKISQLWTTYSITSKALWDLRFSWRWLRRMPSSGMLRHVTLVRTDDSEGRIASIISVIWNGEQGTLAVTSNRSTLRRNTPGSYWIGGWMGHRASLDGMDDWKFFTIAGLEVGRPNSYKPDLSASGFLSLLQDSSWFLSRLIPSILKMKPTRFSEMTLDYRWTIKYYTQKWQKSSKWNICF
jgi:hypothetical protein